MDLIKSPIHYMGNKYDLLPYILEQLPPESEVNTFYDVFGGSGTVSLNVPYNNIIYNELNDNMVNLLNMIKNEKPENLINHIKNRIKEFELNEEGTDTRQNKVEIEDIRKHYNQNYNNFRDYYNRCTNKDVKDLYTLSFYSFCNLMRFNAKNEFNMPYGNSCFSKADEYLITLNNKRLNSINISINQKDAFELLESIKENNNQFLYLDPPYINSTAIYNENRAFGGWNENDDNKLFNELNRLSKLGIKWAYSNVLAIKGKENNHIENWAKENGYTIIEFEDKNYSALGKGNANAREVLIINYEQRVKKYSIFDFMEE